MSYGLTSTGFRIMRQPEILDALKAAAINKFGNVQTDAMSVLGQLLGVESQPAIDVWEQLQNIFYGLNPETATGIALDYCVFFNGITRLPAIASLVTIGLNGTLGSLIPENTLFRSNISTNLFKSLTDITLSLTTLHRAYVEIRDIQADTDYEFWINGDGIHVLANSGPAPDVEVTIEAMVDQINAVPSSSVIAYNLGNGALFLHAKVETGTFDLIDIDGNVFFYNLVECQSILTGQIPVSIRTIDIIETPVAGLDSAINFQEGTLGRARETDSELRIRRRASLQISGSANLEAIVSRIQKEVVGITACKGYENVEDTLVGDMPPHSIKIICQGGENHDIAELLWRIKGGGIKTVGNTSHDVIDSNGDTQTLYFTRPVIKYGWVHASIVLYDEEIFPSNGIQTIKDLMYAYGQTFTIGLDIIPQRFISNIFPNVPGLQTVIISVAKTTNPGDTPSYSLEKISIAADEIAVFSPIRIFCEYLA